MAAAPVATRSAALAALLIVDTQHSGETSGPNNFVEVKAGSDKCSIKHTR